ncbi:MAG: SIMPL domain-containing protein [Candidatus Gastranaerophilales bacterium]|nr:SIMPL domain-containing protein [Candidatus Gastranaerophilales bacterium]
MKKNFVLFLSIIMTCFIGLKTSALAEGGYITTTASSKIELTADIINFDVEIKSVSKDSMDKAIAENKKVSAKVYDNLNKAINKTSGDSLKTYSYSATSVYKYVNNKKVFDCYQVTNRVRVHTKNIANAGKIMDTAMSDGAASVSNISYDVSSYETECNKLLSETSKKAKEQAESIAKSIGSEITGIKSIEGSCSMSNKNVVPRMLMSAKAASLEDDESETTSTTVEAGTMTLNARVNANFYIK